MDKDLDLAFKTQVLKDIYKESANLRRLWRKQPIDPELLSEKLAMVRKMCYAALRLDRLFK